MSENRELRWAITADDSGFMERMRRVRASIRAAAGDAERGGSDIDGAIGKLGGSLGKLSAKVSELFSPEKALEFAKACVAVRAQVESTSGGETLKKIYDKSLTKPVKWRELSDGILTDIIKGLEKRYGTISPKTKEFLQKRREENEEDYYNRINAARLDALGDKQSFLNIKKNMKNLNPTIADQAISELDKELNIYREIQEQIAKPVWNSNNQSYDRRAMILNEIARSLFTIHEGYVKLSKTEGPEKAIGLAREEFSGLIDDIKNLSERYNFNLPDIDVPTGIKEMDGYIKSITAALQSVPRSDRVELSIKNRFARWEAIQAKGEADRLKAARGAMLAYLKEYGSYEQKRKAIEEEYGEKIRMAPNRGERLQAIAERNQAVSGLELEEWEKKGGLADAFGDVTKLSKEMVRELIRDMECCRGQIAATFDPEKIEKFEEALGRLRAEDIGERLDGLFDSGEFTKGLRERLVLQKQISDEAKTAAELERQQGELWKEYNELIGKASLNTSAAGPDGKRAGESGLSDEEQVRADELRVKLDAVAEAIRQSGNNAKKLEEELRKLGRVRFEDIKKLTGTLGTAGRNASELAGIFSDDLGGALATGAEMIDTMTDSIGTMAAAFKSLGKQSTETIEKAAEAGKEIAEGTKEGVTATAASTSAAISTIEKASAVLAIIGAAIQLATMMAKLFNSDAKHEKRIEALQDRIDSLERSYDRLGKRVSATFSYESAAAIEAQNANLREQQALIRQQRAEEEQKKKSDKDALKGYDEALEDIEEQIRDNAEAAKDAIFGSDIKSQIEQFADAYAGAWESGESRALTAKDTVRKLMRQMVEESVKAAIEGSGAMARIREQLEEFYSDGLLSYGEQQEIYALADQLQKELDARFGEQADLLHGDSLLQTASSRGWETMSESSAEALDGRFTALCETGEGIRAINAGIAESVRGGLESMRNIGGTLEESLNVQLISMGHLEAISRNTRVLAEMREDLTKIERYVRNL